MKRYFILLVVIAMVFCMISTENVYADIPEIISYQGILADSAGEPLTGNYDITVRIYDQAIGGGALWTETHSGVVVGEGKFNVMLGAVNPLSSSLGFDIPYWLGVTINGGDELTPRTQFASVATAFAARKVLERILPAGMVAPFATTKPPAGWLACKGQAVSRTTYADLYKAIGKMYGAGNRTTTFNLPDYRGNFLRGFDNGAKRDPDAAQRTNRGDGTVGDAVGTRQTDQFKSHNHKYYKSYDLRSDDGDKNDPPPGYTKNSYTSSSKTGGSETRPENISVLYCIKY